MNTHLTITAISHDELVDLFSTALYSSRYLDAKYCHGLAEYDEKDCYEDRLAKCLLANKALLVYDYYADGETYGTLYSEVGADDSAVYTLTLADLLKGLERAANSDKHYMRRAYNRFVDNEENGEFDYIEADILLQTILFGDVIYG